MAPRKPAKSATPVRSRRPAGSTKSPKRPRGRNGKTLAEVFAAEDAAKRIEGVKAAAPPQTKTLDHDNLLAKLRKGGTLGHTEQELADYFAATPDAVRAVIGTMHNQGVLVALHGDRWVIEKAPPPVDPTATGMVYRSRPDGTYKFGALGDSHLGSRHERLDVLNDLYDVFAAEGVDCVFHTGNWVDGESRFNTYDIHTHGMDDQLNYLIDKYPRRPGITTYAVSGDDHEGWWAQKHGVNPGRRLQEMMRSAGRDDWADLGYIEAFVTLQHAKTKAESKMLVQHPGGGSAYALSYSIQKIVESLEGGEKPAVLLSGHYHKLWAGNIRNVWCLQTGCQKDQDAFMRKKRLAAHVGGAVVTIHQDAKTGAITRFLPDILRYFNRGYYNNRWSPSGSVTLPVRAVGTE